MRVRPGSHGLSASSFDTRGVVVAVRARPRSRRTPVARARTTHSAGSGPSRPVVKFERFFERRRTFCTRKSHYDLCVTAAAAEGRASETFVFIYAVIAIRRFRIRSARPRFLVRVRTRVKTIVIVEIRLRTTRPNVSDPTLSSWAVRSLHTRTTLILVRFYCFVCYVLNYSVETNKNGV